MVSMVEFGRAKMPLESRNPGQQRFSLSLGLGLELDLDDKSGREAIHSGHFMVSEIDDTDVQEEDETTGLDVHDSDDAEVVVMSPNRQDDLSLGALGLPEIEVNRQGKKEPNLGLAVPQSISIDASLTKLLECMTLVYSGKLTSPRWKTFKGVKMRLKEKIRLNNIIWRAWHLQFVARCRPFVCQFASPLEGEIRNKPEAVVLEGKYLKRGMKTVIAEYRKCRMFYRDRLRFMRNRETGETVAMDLDFRWPSWSNSSVTSGIEEDLFMDFSDTLFGTLIPNEPFDFPNPREIARAGIADFIQPGLVQLQPALDDFMDTFEPLQDILNARMLPTLPEEGPLLDNNRTEVSGFQRPHSIQSIQGTGGLNSGTSQLIGARDYQGNSFLLTSSQEAGQVSPLIKMEPTSILQQRNSFITYNSSNAARVACVSDENKSSLFETPDSLLNNNETSLSPDMGETQPLNSSPLINSPHSPMLAPQTVTATVFSPKFRNTELPSYSSPAVRRNTVPSVPMMRSIIQPRLNKPSVLAGSASLLKPAKLNNYSQSSFNLQNVNMSSEVQSMNNNHLDERLTAGLSIKPPMFQPPVHSAGRLVQQVPANPITTQSMMQTGFVSKVEDRSKGQLQSAFTSKVGVPILPVAKSKRTMTRAELVNSRRHSLAGNPPLVTENIQIKPAGGSSNGTVPKDGHFVVPKVQAKQRTRSRSISSPQHGSNVIKNITPKSASSLSNISISPPPSVTSLLTSSSVTNHHMSPLLPAPPPHRRTAAAANTGMMPTNRLLAQFISPGVSFQRTESGSITCNTTSTSTVAIISSVPTSQPAVQQTLVLSPVTLANALHTWAKLEPSSFEQVPGVTELQRSLLMGTSGNVFSSVQMSSPKLTMPPSPGSVNLDPGSPPSPASAQKSSADSNPVSPPKVFRPKSDVERIQYKEHKRVCHINAEQKRRCNIKHGFEAIHQLVPSLCHNPNAKVSKAAMLQKAVDYIRTLKAERGHQIEEAETLKKQIDQLNQTINMYQNQLPASGAPVPSQRTNHMRERFDEYVKASSLQNWKFWIFSLLLEPLLESFSSTVSTASVDELCKTTMTWLSQHCSLASLRPVVLNSLRHLSTSTSILTDPGRLPEEATRAIAKKEKSSK